MRLFFFPLFYCSNTSGLRTYKRSGAPHGRGLGLDTIGNLLYHGVEGFLDRKSVV